VAVDRGGLNYGIAVRDEFSANVAKFVAGVQQAKAEFASFRAEVSKGGGSAKALNQLTRATKQAADGAKARSKDVKSSSQEEASAAKTRLFLIKQEEAAEKRLFKAAKEASRLRRKAEREGEQARKRGQTEEGRAEKSLQVSRDRTLRQLQRLADAQRQRESEAKRINLQARRDSEANAQGELQRIQDLANRREALEQQRLQLSRGAAKERARLESLNPEVQGRARADDLIRARATAQEAIASLRRMGREELITGQLRRQAGELERSARSANSLLFTFRRLVGVLAAFQIARALVGGFRDIITLGIRFNDQIRQAEIGIAGLLVSLADIRDEQGRSTEGAEKFARAFTIAREQVAQLRQDALLTTATLEQLAETFQVALAPGLQAGLNVDEIRKLAVSISQAATAIGVPQNQLAEEIRSLLTGTIQARTSRIPTALGITNADIRRLREAGELAPFLAKRFQEFGRAAELAARQTLTGIGALVRDALGLILGGAAQPLFEELIKLGNEVFDQVLTIKDAAGDVRPRPEAVAAFRALFDGLRDGVRSARELAKELGFEGLRDIVGTIGTGLNVALQAALGFAGSIGRAFSTIVGIVRQLSGLFGDTNTGVGNLSRLIGRLAADFFILRTAARLFGINLTAALSPARIRETGAALRAFIATPLGKGGLIGVALVGVLKGFELILEKILGINLSLSDTARLLAKGIQTQLDDIITEGLVGLTTVAESLKKFFTDDADAKAEIERRAKLFRDALRADNAAQNAELEALLLEIQNRGLPKPPGAPDTETEAAAKRAAEFASIVSNVESVIARANGVLAEMDEEIRELGATFDAASRSTGASGFAGTIESAFSEAAVQTQIKSREIQAAIDQTVKAIEKGSQIINLAPSRLGEIRRTAAQPAGEEQDRAITALQLTAEEGKLLSLLRDEILFRATLGELEQLSVQTARLKVGIVARETLPELQREVATLQAQATAETALSDAVVGRVGARRLAVIEAQNELAIARQQSAEQLRQIAEQAAAARQFANSPITGFDTKEAEARDRAARAAAGELATALEERLRLETDIAAEQEKQLKFAEAQARLAEEGTFTQGIREGLRQLADDLPTVFEGARDLIVSITREFSAAASQAAVDFVRTLADENFEVDFKERLGQLGLSIAQSIFQNLIDTALQQLIAAIPAQAVDQGVEAAGDAAKAAADAAAQQAKNAAELLQAQAVGTVEIGTATSIATIETTAANTAAFARTTSAAALKAAAAAELAAAQAAATIRAGSSAASSGGNKGGFVTLAGIGRHFGGHIPDVSALVAKRAQGLHFGGRPRGLHPADTVPAWLTPGEFVVPKPQVDRLGLGFFESIRSGNFGVPKASPPSGEGAVGMIRGGRVEAQRPRRSSGDSRERVMVVPAIVTSEREMDRLQAGGRNANFQFLRENRETVRGILGV
jgi:hypothetical protein